MNTLFDKTTLRNLELRNRAWRSATWMALADNDGFVTDELVEAYEELAQGCVAVIVTGLTSIVEDDAPIGRECKFYDDRFIEGHKKLTDTIHRHGSKAMMQTAIVDGPLDELTTEQVESVIHAFGDAARRAEQAGYDGVQIHAAHFFYLSKFISPLINHRTDRFGGNQHRRTQILLEILNTMRSKTSDDFCITVKINSSDEYLGGLTRQDFVVSSQLLADAGIDAIEVSANGTSRGGIRAGVNEAYFLDAAKLLAERVNVPIVLVGGLRSILKINEILKETTIAYISLSRPLIREPNLINRWQQGDTTPSKCVSCNSCYRTLGHRCLFN